MGILLPLGAALIVIGTAGSAAACYGNAIFDGGKTSTVASGMQDQTDAPANAGDDGSVRLYLAPLAGLALAIGLVCVGIGIGDWRRPIPSEVRPANRITISRANTATSGWPGPSARARAKTCA